MACHQASSAQSNCIQMCNINGNGWMATCQALQDIMHSSLRSHAFQLPSALLRIWVKED